MFGYIPNLSIGVDKNMTADEKQVERYMCLSEILREFEEICNSGGFKTRINGREVVLKFFIQFISGDTAGHNDLYCHYQKA